MTKFKTLILVVLQYIVVSWLWVVTCIEQVLTSLMGFIAKALFVMSPVAISILMDVAGKHSQAIALREDCPVDTPDLSQPQTDRDSDIQDILMVLDKRNNHHLKGDRIVFENTTTGLEVVADHADLHLYSVQHPTRSDNFTIIENVLRAMSPADLRRTGENARKTMQIYS